MGKFFIRQSIKREISPIKDSFQFNYGTATILLETDGKYKLYVNGFTYSDLVNSARRSYNYKPTQQRMALKLKEEYDELTFDYTHLNYNLRPSKSVTDIEQELDELVLKKYSKKNFSLSQPTEEDVRTELYNEAAQIYFKIFGKDKKKINEYINSKLQESLEQRLKAWNELSIYHNKIQAQKAEQQNLIYFTEYSEKKEDLENKLSDSASYVDSEFKKRLSSIKLPFDIELEYKYLKKQKTLDVEVELQSYVDVPTQKATILSTGLVSVTKKTIREQEIDLQQCLYGLSFYLASEFFNITTQLEKLSITIWEKGKYNGILWVEFPRDKFNYIIKGNKSFDPTRFISIGMYYSTMGLSSSKASTLSQRNVFIKQIEDLKQGIIPTPPISSSPRVSNNEDWGYNNESLFHLSISDARILASYVNDPSLMNDIDNAVWAGDTTVTIHPKYKSIWYKIKQ